MRVMVRLLDENAERCIQLAYQCKNKNAERILRALAVDLMLAAEHHRLRPAGGGPDPLDELRRLSDISRRREMV